jgi:hypothetical protein
MAMRGQKFDQTCRQNARLRRGPPLAISRSSKQGCLPPDPWKVEPSEQPLARDQRRDVRVRTRRSMSSHLLRKWKRIKKHRTETLDEEVQSYRTPTFAGEDAMLTIGGVAATRFSELTPQSRISSKGFVASLRMAAVPTSSLPWWCSKTIVNSTEMRRPSLVNPGTDKRSPWP